MHTAAAAAAAAAAHRLLPLAPLDFPRSDGGRDSSFERKVRRAKRAARSELSVSRGEWRKWGFAGEPSLVALEPPPGGLQADGLPLLDGSRLSVEEFVERYERPRRPCVITGLCDGWRAAREWTPDRLLERLGGCKFKVRSCCQGAPLRAGPSCCVLTGRQAGSEAWAPPQGSARCASTASAGPAERPPASPLPSVRRRPPAR